MHYNIAQLGAEQVPVRLKTSTGFRYLFSAEPVLVPAGRAVDSRGLAAGAWGGPHGAGGGLHGAYVGI